MRLLDDRICLSGRTALLGSYVREVRLDEVVCAEWNTRDESYNLVLQTADEALLLHVPHAAQWKFAIEQAFPAVGRPSPGLPTLHHSAQDALRRKPTSSPRPAPRRARELPRPAPAPEPERSLLDGAVVEAYEVRRRGPMTLSLHLEDGRSAHLVAYGRVMLHLQMSEDEGAPGAERPTPLRAMRRETASSLLRTRSQA